MAGYIIQYYWELSEASFLLEFFKPSIVCKCRYFVKTDKIVNYRFLSMATQPFPFSIEEYIMKCQRVAGKEGQKVFSPSLDMVGDH